MTQPKREVLWKKQNDAYTLEFDSEAIKKTVSTDPRSIRSGGTTTLDLSTEPSAELRMTAYEDGSALVWWKGEAYGSGIIVQIGCAQYVFTRNSVACTVIKRLLKA